MEKVQSGSEDSLDDILSADSRARAEAERLITKSTGESC